MCGAFGIRPEERQRPAWTVTHLPSGRRATPGSGSFTKLAKEFAVRLMDGRVRRVWTAPAVQEESDVAAMVGWRSEDHLVVQHRLAQKQASFAIHRLE